MIDTKKKTVCIIGSGLAGSFLAVLLARRGYTVSIFEKLSQKEIEEESSKRSYNIILYGYALTLLKQAGLWNEIIPYLLPLKGTVTHIPNAKPIRTIIDSNKMPYYTVSRAKLAYVLRKIATTYKSVSIYYETPLISINRYEKTITVEDSKTKQTKTEKADLIIGADGANSLVRIFMQQGQQTNHMQEYASFIYKQFILPVELVEKLHLEKQYEHTWTQKNVFIISHPDKNNALSGLLVIPKNKQTPKLSTPAEIKTFFTNNFPELLPAINEITSSLLQSAEGNFSTIHTDPWYYKDFMTIIGDAAHGFYPFFGQGTSAAFGDGMLLVKLLDTHQDAWDKIFPLYQKERKRHMDTLGNLSKDVMMKYFRYKKADHTAIYDKVENVLHSLFPKIIIPPLFFSLITDPEHADDHWQKHEKQKKIEKVFGVTLAVSALTGLITIIEKSKKHK